VNYVHVVSTIGVALFSWAIGVYSLGVLVESTTQCPAVALDALEPVVCQQLQEFATYATIAAIIGGGLLVLAMVLARHPEDPNNDNVSTN